MATNRVTTKSADGREIVVEFATDDLFREIASRLLGIESRQPRRAAPNAEKVQTARALDGAEIQQLRNNRLAAIQEAAGRLGRFGAIDMAAELESNSLFANVNATQVIQRLLRDNTGDGRPFRKVGKRWESNQGATADVETVSADDPWDDLDAETEPATDEDDGPMRTESPVKRWPPQMSAPVASGMAS